MKRVSKIEKRYRQMSNAKPKLPTIQRHLLTREDTTIVSARAIMQLIVDNKLNTTERYEAFRKAHPKMMLPAAILFIHAYKHNGWDFNVVVGKARHKSSCCCEEEG